MKLPINCSAEYLSDFLSKENAEKLYRHLMEYFGPENSNLQLMIAGKTETFEFGKFIFLDQELLDQNKFPEEGWGKTGIWSNELLEI